MLEGRQLSINSMDGISWRTQDCQLYSSSKTLEGLKLTGYWCHAWLGCASCYCVGHGWTGTSQGAAMQQGNRPSA